VVSVIHPPRQPSPRPLRVPPNLRQAACGELYMGVESPLARPMRASSQGAVGSSLQLGLGGSPSVNNYSHSISTPVPSTSPHRMSAPGNKASTGSGDHRPGQLQLPAYQPGGGLPLPPSSVPVFPLPSGAPLHSNSQMLQRLPSVDKMAGNRPSSAFVSLTSSYRSVRR
jgi:hypothetical protein